MTEFLRWVLSCPLVRGNCITIGQISAQEAVELAELGLPKFGDGKLDLVIAFGGADPTAHLHLLASHGLVVGEGIGPYVPGWSIEHSFGTSQQFFRMKRQ